MYRSTFLDLGTSWRLVVNFTSRPLYPRRKSPLVGGWVGHRAGLDDVEKRKFLTSPGLELRLLCRPARRQSLYRLSYPGSPECGVHGLICDTIRYLTGDMKKTMNSSVSVDDVPGEIQTERPRSTSRRRYNLFQIGWTVIASHLITFAT
jgi:hypothetical protein